jgi:hypothetical protein
VVAAHIGAAHAGGGMVVNDAIDAAGLKRFINGPVHRRAIRLKSERIVIEQDHVGLI